MEDLAEGFTPHSQEGVAILCATLGLTLCFLLLAFLCLKIKSTKKTPELLGTVGTVKRLDEPSSPQVCTDFDKIKNLGLSKLAKVDILTFKRIKNLPKLRFEAFKIDI